MFLYVKLGVRRMMSIVWLVGVASIVLALFLVTQLVKSKPDKELVRKGEAAEDVMRELQGRMFRLGFVLFLGLFAVLVWFTAQWSFVAFFGGVLVAIALARMTMWTRERARARNEVVRAAGSNAILVSSVALLSSAGLLQASMQYLVAFSLGAACMAFFVQAGSKFRSAGNLSFFAMMTLGVAALSGSLSGINGDVFVLVVFAASVIAACISIAVSRELRARRSFLCMAFLVLVFQGVLSFVLLGGFVSSVVSAVGVLLVLYLLAWYYGDRSFRPVKSVMRALTRSVSDGITRVFVVACETLVALFALMIGIVAFQEHALIVFGMTIVSFAPFVLFLRNAELLQDERILFAHWFEIVGSGIVALFAMLAYVALTAGTVGPAGAIINVMKIPSIVALVLGVVATIAASALVLRRGNAHSPVVFVLAATLLVGVWLRAESLIAFVLGGTVSAMIVSLVGKSAWMVIKSAGDALTEFNGKDGLQNARVVERVARMLPSVQVVALMMGALALTFVSVLL